MNGWRSVIFNMFFTLVPIWPVRGLLYVFRPLKSLWDIIREFWAVLCFVRGGRWRMHLLSAIGHASSFHRLPTKSLPPQNRKASLHHSMQKSGNHDQAKRTCYTPESTTFHVVRSVAVWCVKALGFSVRVVTKPFGTTGYPCSRGSTCFGRRL